MKRIIATTYMALLCAMAIAQITPHKDWKMVWHDEFDGVSVDSSRWSVVPRGTSNWDRYMSQRADLIKVENGNVVMTGIQNPDRSKDTAAYLTGGLYSKDKFSFLYGKIEICARLASVQGAWPAFWLLPADEQIKWPMGGEIDIMEHLNFDDYVYQTVHSYYTLRLGMKDTPKNFATAKINRDHYNVYGLEWNASELIFSINGNKTFRYPKIKTDKEGQWPFDTPFYILIDQQLGGKGTWPGEVRHDQLPVKMWIDYVRVYQHLPDASVF